MMLSLACDSRKFVAEREGRVAVRHVRQVRRSRASDSHAVATCPAFRQRQGPADLAATDRCLAPHARRRQWRKATSRIAQCTYVAPVDDAAPAGSPAWVRERAVACRGVLGQEPGTRGLRGRARADAQSRRRQHAAGRLGADTAGHRRQGRRSVAGVARHEQARTAAEIQLGRDQGDGFRPVAAGRRRPRVSPTCPPGPPHRPTSRRCCKAAPFAPRVERYWNAVLEPATQIELPDGLLTNVIRASQVHCLLAARNEDAGRRVSPWISSDRYGPLESEANSIVRGMGLMGHDEFARRSLDYFIGRYNKAGYLTTGYTMVGTGEHLWTLAEHYQRVPDEAWLKAIAPEVARACKWIVAQRAKTKLLDGRGEQVPEYGLFPPGVTADWNRYAYRFFNDAQYCAGLGVGCADVERRSSIPTRRPCSKMPGQYREDLVRAYRCDAGPFARRASGRWHLGAGRSGAAGLPGPRGGFPAGRGRQPQLGLQRRDRRASSGRHGDPRSHVAGRRVDDGLPGGVAVPAHRHGGLSGSEESPGPLQLRRVRQGAAVLRPIRRGLRRPRRCQAVHSRVLQRHSHRC